MGTRNSGHEGSGQETMKVVMKNECKNLQKDFSKTWATE